MTGVQTCALPIYLGSTPAKITVIWPELKLTGKQRVRDLWRQQDLGIFEEKFEATVETHGVVFVRFFPSN